MWRILCNFLPTNKLNVHTKEGVFLSFGTQYFSKSIFNLVRDHWVNTVVHVWDLVVIYKTSDGGLVFIYRFTFNATLIWIEFDSQLWKNFKKFPTITEHSLSFHWLPLRFSCILTSPLLIFINVLYSRFTLNTISTNLPSNIMCTTLSSGSDAQIYAPGTSKFCTDIPSWASIINDAKSDYSEMLGNVISSRVI